MQFTYKNRVISIILCQSSCDACLVNIINLHLQWQIVCKNQVTFHEHNQLILTQETALADVGITTVCLNMSHIHACNLDHLMSRVHERTLIEFG